MINATHDDNDIGSSYLRMAARGLVSSLSRSTVSHSSVFVLCVETQLAAFLAREVPTLIQYNVHSDYVRIVSILAPRLEASTVTSSRFRQLRSGIARIDATRS